MKLQIYRTDKSLTKDSMLFPCGMSRSGTTLLTTVLDSHSQISLGYELIPPKLPAPMILKQALEEGLKQSNGDFESCGEVLRKKGNKDIGLFFSRCYRAGISQDDIVYILDKIEHEGINKIETLRERLEIAWRIALQKKLSEETRIYGFKFNAPSVEEAFQIFPGGYFIYIIRDPRDVVASHIQRGFDRTTEEICKAWNNYIKCFEKFHAKQPSISLIIRYEDLVSEPRGTVEEIFRKLPLEIEEGIFEFYRSKASVHQAGHPNIENLQKNFFTSSIGRWRSELKRAVTAEIEKHCRGKMEKYSYV